MYLISCVIRYVLYDMFSIICYIYRIVFVMLYIQYLAVSYMICYTLYIVHSMAYMTCYMLYVISHMLSFI